jgi:hypothetical protein
LRQTPAGTTGHIGTIRTSAIGFATNVTSHRRLPNERPAARRAENRRARGPGDREDRCSHDDGPLAEGPLDVDNCTIECPRHGSLFDLRTGTPKTLPAYEKVDTFAVTVEDDIIKLEIDY